MDSSDHAAPNLPGFSELGWIRETSTKEALLPARSTPGGMVFPAKDGVEEWGFGDSGVVLSPLRKKERRKEISGSNSPPLPENTSES